jgi:phosphoribosylformimino-5-aminoimidazole carboxamide ribotide isomerase
MRVIPVIDLLHGRVVHAVKGHRENYQPVKSVLCDQPELLLVARAFRDLLRLKEVYIADLNAIQDLPPTLHKKVITDLARREGMDIILDAGVSDIEEARELLGIGVHKVVVGAETLQSWYAMQAIPGGIHSDRLIFSLDLRDGRILSRCPDLSAMAPLEALEYLQSAGWREVILLDLARVGGGKGIDLSLVLEARKKLPDLRLLVGGGIGDPTELFVLESSSVSGVLIASALHRGTITARHISALAGNRS